MQYRRKLIVFLLTVFIISSCADDNNDASLTKFAVLSDIHVSPSGIDNNGHLYSKSEELFLNAVNEINADGSIGFVLISGDLTKDGLITEHEAFRQIMSQIDVPVYLVPGNHDVEHPGKDGPEYMKKTDFASFYTGFGYVGAGNTYYAAQIFDGVLLIALDSTIYAPGGGIIEDFGGMIDTEQLSWLETTLNENSDKKVIVMVHHNINEHVYNQATNDLLKDFYLNNAPELKAILSSHGVNVVFTGHSHIVDIKEEGGIYDIVTTSLIMYPLGYRVCSLNERSISVESKAVLVSDINGEPANDHAYTQLSGFIVDELSVVLTLPPYSYGVVSANLIAASAAGSVLKVFNGDENVQDMTGIPEEFAPYFIDAAPADNRANIPFK